ncbi:type IV secretion system protein [Variovorax fucosicus]|uniref:type IV secretion system protein n=1 Tax=Variovorax fucosicus TaxID=3053517 RepID=UPI002577D8A0|nr:type IV secretion system protein [Variovorax sp. J22G47]MDM0058393.1 type IV secretion system protein [Variovorax sp. J22G47]
MDMAYFALIYAWVDDRINTFRDNLMQNAMSAVAAIALVLFTAWIMVQGFRIVTGQSREPMMGLVVNASRTTLILIAASTMALGGSSIQTFFTDTMASGINGLVTGNDEKPEKVIDKNLVYTAVAMAAIDGAQGLNASNSPDNVAAAGRASLIAMLGVAGPPMTAAAMLLMYKVALALFIGFGPIFIMCLIFKVTESMFWRWLNYGLGTLFSMAVLSFMVSLVLDLTLRVAGALWATGALTKIFDLEGNQGLTNQAMQQGGIGLLMTTLLISAPPMAAAFFGGTMGSFNPYPAVSGGQQNAGSPGSGGQPAGSYAQQAPDKAQTAPVGQPSGGLGSNLNRASVEPPADQIRPASVPPPPKALKVDGEA